MVPVQVYEWEVWGQGDLPILSYVLLLWATLIGHQAVFPTLRDCVLLNISKSRTDVGAIVTTNLQGLHREDRETTEVKQSSDTRPSHDRASRSFAYTDRLPSVWIRQCWVYKWPHWAPQRLRARHSVMETLLTLFTSRSHFQAPDNELNTDHILF